MAKKNKKRDKSKKRKKKLATLADRHDLYQRSVQNPDFEVELADSYFRRRVGRKPLTRLEDFCGTALLCAEWVKSDPNREATGVDISGEVLGWGRQHNIVPLGEDAERVSLVEGDVRTVHETKFDVVMALNYSYFCFQDRPTLRGYFEKVRENLGEDGLFFLDLFGGWESVQELEEERKCDDFWYIWHQASYDAIQSHFLGHIHFRFKDGSKMKKAFTYDWRLWNIRELRELLEEAGFRHTEVLWEGEDEDGEGNGVYRPREKVGNDPGWNAYILASVDTPKRLRK